MALWRRIDEAPAAEARRLLTECCGATRWVEAMLRRRPFGSHQAILAAARDMWWSLGPDHWREAFRHHPKIGDKDSLRSKFASTQALSESEQSSVSAASEAVLDALANCNRDYEERFGYIFIVCATGKTAEEMLALLRARIVNDPATEIRVAAEEQAKITAIRLSRE
ncbi:MAG: 2-oxo-4-hydroxy-4-carboxy-5-ureidoimidazoline decarboxylase [Vicinamibacterales bacterium]